MTEKTFDDFLNNIQLNPKELTQEAIDVIYIGYAKLYNDKYGVDPSE